MNRKVVKWVVVLCSFAFAVWYFSYSAEVREKASTKNSISLARVAAQNYYDAYRICNSSPPPEAIDQVSTYCQENNPYGTDLLAEELLQFAKVNEIDSVICGQNIPINTHVEKTTGKMEGGIARVVVVARYGPRDITKIQVQLVQVGDTYKVQKITCPLPK